MIAFPRVTGVAYTMSSCDTGHTLSIPALQLHCREAAK
jgi:hypothetical protein